VATLTDKVLLHVIQETVDRGGVQVELRQVAIASKQWLEGNGATFAGKYADVPTIATIYFRVKNTRQDTINLYVNQATVVVNSEQIELAPYIIEGRAGDDLGGEFLPGVEAIGSISFPIERSTVPEIERMLVKINGPVTESFERLGEDIEFTLDLSEHRVDPALPGTLETN